MADTARHVTSSNLRSPGDGGQSPSSNGRGNNSSNNSNGDNNFQEFSSNVYSESVPVKRGQHYYELQRSAFEQKSAPQQQLSNGQPNKQSTFRSNSQEELDKLLAGLDKLTETLPDLNSVRSYSSLSGTEKPLKDTSVNGVAESYNYKQINNQQQQQQNDIYRPLSQQQQQQQRDSSTPDRQLSLIRYSFAYVCDLE